MPFAHRMFKDLDFLRAKKLLEKIGRLAQIDGRYNFIVIEILVGHARWEGQDLEAMFGISEGYWTLSYIIYSDFMSFEFDVGTWEGCGWGEAQGVGFLVIVEGVSL